MWIIGIDGGGTKCAAGLFTLKGELLCTALSGPANLFTDFAGALICIEQAVEQLLLSCKTQHNIAIEKKDCYLSLGCAGASIISVRQHFEQWTHQFYDTLLNTDVHVSCLAANEAKPCALFVIGTGSCLAVNQTSNQNNEHSTYYVKQYGGHGFMLGDIASGGWLGKQAVSWYLQSLETPCDDECLMQTLAPVLGENVSHVVQQYGQARAGDFGELVPRLLWVKDKSNTVNNWLEEGADYVADLLIHHIGDDKPIFLTGGLAQVYKPMVEERLAKQVFIPNENAVYGAFLAAQQHLRLPA
jgi:glucosamine kinase